MRTIVILALLGVACAPAEKPAPKQTVTYDRRQEIRIVAEPLESAVARSIIDIPGRDDQDKGDTGWTYAFFEDAPVTTRDGISRPFRIRIDNRSDSLGIFEAVIEYFDQSGAPVRTRTFRRLVVPPWTRNVYEGQTLVPAGQEITSSGRVRRAMEE